jgi:hypothetical protein
MGEAFRRWLPNVHQQIELFFSPSDIEKGTKWATEVDAQLRDTRFCLVCLTPEALTSTWLNFEAGAISKGIGQNKVAPILFDLSKSDVSGPLSLFQLADFVQDEIRDVIRAINNSFEGQRINEDLLVRAFDRWWPDLERGIQTIRTDVEGGKTPTKSVPEMTQEILLTSR